MTIRRFTYRYIYLKTPGWALTRALRMSDECKQCASKDTLQLHHVNYPFFGVWYRLFWLSLIILAFDNRGVWLLAVLAITPDLISRVKTLCKRCHHLVEMRKKGY